MDSAPLISIIIPIFNVEQYLAKCIDSIINQTYENIEIILVDDGSPDNCPKICDDYSKKDKRIIVLHKLNGGLSDARNAGIDKANGEYIGFVDSDDWVEQDMYETLVNLILLVDADIAECGISFHFKNFITKSLESKITVCEKLKTLECFLDRSIDIKGSVCNKLYNRKIIDKIRFPVGKLHEDAFFTYKALYYSKKYIRTESCKYNYLQERVGSIMSEKVKPINILTVIEAFEERNDFLLNNNEEILYLKSKAYYYGTLLSEYKKLIFKLKEEKELKKILKNKLLINFRDIIKNPYTNKTKFLVFKVVSFLDK